MAHQSPSEGALAPSVAHLFAAAAQGHAFPPPQHSPSHAHFPPQPFPSAHGSPPPPFLHGPPPHHQQTFEHHPDLHQFAQQHHQAHQQQQHPQQQFHSPPHRYGGPPPQHAHAFPGAPPLHQSPPHMFEFGHHEQALQQHNAHGYQQHPQQQSPPYASGTHAPPPSRQQSSTQDLSSLHHAHHPPVQQSSGIGALLGQTDDAVEAVVPVIGVVLSSGALSASPAHKSLGGEEHASTPCSEFSQLARDMSAEKDAGCLIAHQADVTVFALKGGIVRLVRQAAGEENKQSEVLKAHTERVLDIAFLPPSSGSTSTEQLLVTLSAKQAVLWRLRTADSKLIFAVAARVNAAGSSSLRRVRVQSEADENQALALLYDNGQVSLLRLSALMGGGADGAAAAGAAASVTIDAPSPLAHVTDVSDAAWRRSASSADWQLVIATGKGGVALLQRDGAADAQPSFLAANAESAAIDRLLLLPSSFLLVARKSFRLLQFLSAQTGAVVSELSLAGPAHEDVLYNGLELAGRRFAVLTYRLQEPTGEASDQGFIVLQLGTSSPSFEFASAFWQPAPIASCSAVVAPEDNEHEDDEEGCSFDLYAVEQKPIVRLHISRSAVYRQVPRAVGGAVAASSGAPLLTRVVSHGQGELLEPEAEEAEQQRERLDHDDIVADEERLDAVPALRSSLPKLMVPAAHDAAAAAVVEGSASGDSPPSPSASTSSSAAATASTSLSSTPGHRMQSPGLRMERGGGPDFSPVEQPAHLLDDYNSGRNSPAISVLGSAATTIPTATAGIGGGSTFNSASITSIGSPPKPMPTLRPRGNSMESSLSRNVSFNMASSQPTPAGTPAPGTPLLRSSSSGLGISGLGGAGSEGTSPLVSPLPSPRGSVSVSSSLSGHRGSGGGTGTGAPSPGLSPLQHTRVHSTATTTDGSAAQSPVSSSSPSSPPEASTPLGPAGAVQQHTLDESNIGALGSPGTPTILSRGSSSTPSLPTAPPPSSTVTPAATPLSRSSGSGKPSSAISLASMSTADVSLHFLSATSVGQDPSRSVLHTGAGGASGGASGAAAQGGAGAGTGPTSTPLNTPAPSVPSTPRLAGALPPRRSSGMMGMLLGSVGVGGMSGINNSGMSGVGTAASNASLRVRTTSGSTSPSPIGSPSIVGYQKGRSASMDRAADTFGARLLSASVVMEEESSAVDAEVRQHNQQHAPEEHAANKAAASSSAKRTQEATLIQRLDQLFSRHFGRLSGLLAQERLELQQGERARFDALSASLVAAVNEGVEQSVQAGLRDALPLIVAEVGRAAAGSATTGGASNLSAEQVSEAVLSGLNEPLRQSFRTAFTSSLLPSFETAIKAMLAQVASSVASLNSASSSSGNKVAAEALALAQRSAAEAKQRAKEQAEAAKREQHAQAQLAEMTALVKSMAASQAALSESVADMKQQLRAAMAARPTAVTVGPPAAPSSPAQASAAPQPPPTPSSADAFAEVSSLLSQQLFEQAFTRALSSGKLPVVLSACRQIDARTLLTTTIPAHKLSSPVILSLCQQLAASLPGGAGGIVAAGGGATGASSLSDPDLTLKLVWLHECVLAIVPGDALIGAHVRPVLTEVLARLNALPRALVDPTTAPQHFVLVSMTAQAAQLKSA